MHNAHDGYTRATGAAGVLGTDKVIGTVDTSNGSVDLRGLHRRSFDRSAAPLRDTLSPLRAVPASF